MKQSPYTLHYAPDNASLVVRLALLELDQPYVTKLVDRRAHQQSSQSYLALNPNGLIPVLETPQGPLFETAAILLWLCDRHGALGPQPQDAHRGESLKWLFFLSNTLHPALRMLFYSEKYIGDAPEDMAKLSQATQANVTRLLKPLDQQWADRSPGLMHDIYLACMLRWLALYPKGSDTSWFQLGQYPALLKMASHVEALSCTKVAQEAEGLGPTPFTAPHYPVPQEGSAL